MRGTTANWIDSAFAGEILNVAEAVEGSHLIETVLRGGYPEAVSRTTERRRTVWARQYIDALIQRDVRDAASIDKLDHLPRFLRALAQVSGQLCNYSQLGGQIGLDRKKESDLRGLRRLATIAGSHFKCGIILYDGKETLPLRQSTAAPPTLAPL